jgi:putative RNA 2'-phosphotransferase
MERDLVRLSKFLSLLLRHEPKLAGLSLDRGGWVDVGSLISGSRKAGVDLDRDLLRQVVDHGEKKRFSLSADGQRIKANYGHSIDVDLDLEPREPPEILFHGTARHLVEGIKDQGVVRGGRRYVHLSGNERDAEEVGRRHGEPIVLKIRARSMYADGFEFFLSESGIWLTRAVPPYYVEFPTP